MNEAAHPRPEAVEEGGPPPARELARLALVCVGMAAAPGSAIRRDWPCPAGDVRRLAAIPAFRTPLARVGLAAAGVGLSELPAAFFADAAATDTGRLCILLLSVSDEVFEDACLLCAAAVWQRDILKATGKATRKRLQAALGPAAYRVATQEAPTLYPGLSALAHAGEFDAILAATPDDGALRDAFAAAGSAALAGLAAAVAPEFAKLMACRRPEPPDRIVEPDRAALGHLLKLVSRRGPSWPATIN